MSDVVRVIRIILVVGLISFSFLPEVRSYGTCLTCFSCIIFAFFVLIFFHPEVILHSGVTLEPVLSCVHELNCGDEFMRKQQQPVIGCFRLVTCNW